MGEVVQNFFFREARSLTSVSINLLFEGLPINILHDHVPIFLSIFVNPDEFGDVWVVKNFKDLGLIPN